MYLITAESKTKYFQIHVFDFQEDIKYQMHMIKYLLTNLQGMLQ